MGLFIGHGDSPLQNPRTTREGRSTLHHTCHTMYVYMYYNAPHSPACQLEDSPPIRRDLAAGVRIGYRRQEVASFTLAYSPLCLLRLFQRHKDLACSARCAP